VLGVGVPGDVVLGVEAVVLSTEPPGAAGFIVVFVALVVSLAEVSLLRLQPVTTGRTSIDIRVIERDNFISV